ncbi:MAG: L-seryl-tRNA(Sec) selenium transferase [Coriobacteriia bacterium]|nr:L-seryl-tRNA(Sec) selenium transferase [Coriobacteriia bacterium]
MDKQALLRSLPKTDELLKRSDLSALAESASRAVVLDAVRDAVDALRARIVAGESVVFDDDSIADDAIATVSTRMRSSLRPVINATGIIVHTNLGRSRLPEAVLRAVVDASANYSTLEYDVASGERGSRHVHVERLICDVTGAEAAMAVNNNAAATLLGIAGLAARKEAIVSRGQLVEIGGSFRIPDIMRQSGAKMVEVGATNKTHVRDYENAITPKTGLLLKVHSSNYRVVGFTQEVSLAQLVELGAKHGVPVFEDQGSGVLIDLAPYGLPDEPTVRSAVEAGADLVSVSGDKLLGGPQAGILAGKRATIDRLKKHPLARALRLDKMTLAALEATLRLYLDPERALREIPTLAMLTESGGSVGARARALADRIARECADAFIVGVLADVSRAGGGALPLADIPTTVVALTPRAMSANDLESRLRLGEPAIVARIKDGNVLIDPRTLTGPEADLVADRLAAIAAGE